METKPIHFIDERIEVLFDTPPTIRKKPGCPDGFTWQGKSYRIVEMLDKWSDFTRRGKYARNMTPGHAAVASTRGSWGVGRFFFRVRTDSSQVFDLYYDRAPKNVSHRMGEWFLFREMSAA
jgi:hypothetical protein